MNILRDHANLLEFVLERFVSTPLLRGLVVVIVIIVFVVFLIRVMLSVSLGADRCAGVGGRNRQDR